MVTVKISAPLDGSGQAYEAAELSKGRLALITILALSAFLNLFRLTNEGYGIPYYSAAVKDMLTSWHNFFFVSFDSGFVSVDKPPLGLWIQAASAELFGFHSLSLLLPQALAGVLCVALLYHLVRRAFGLVAGLIAALVLAITPVSVATSRNNTMDMLLVLTVLVAAWMVIHAAESGRLRWLLAGAVVVGLGFNIKMLEAFLVLPALYLLYLVAAPVSWGRRFVNLSLATVVLVVVSLSWAVVVDLTPANQRPYVGSTSDDTVTNLILGYNGLDRLRGISVGAEGDMAAGTLGGRGLGAEQNGEPGPFRLLNQHYAGQIGWLLPLALVGLLTASRQERLHLPLDRRQGALVLWGAWFFTTAAYFSVAGGQHRYYIVMLAPAVAALVGVGVVALWSDYRGPGQEGWFLPLTLVGMAALHALILSGYEGWSLRLTPVIVGLCFIAAVVLVALRSKPKPEVNNAYRAIATAMGMLALLIAPTVWASYQVFQEPRGFMPLAGPPSLQNNQGSLGKSAAPGAGLVPSRVGIPSGLPQGYSPSDSANGCAADPVLMDYLLANQGDAEYLVAANSATSTAAIILSTDKPVISLGGYSGIDPVFTTKHLAGLVHEGAVRFFLLLDRAPRGGPGGPPSQARNESARWVQHKCERVPQKLWQSSMLVGQGGTPSMKPQVLYDCGAGGR